MDWKAWHGRYQTTPELKARLAQVKAFIDEALLSMPPGKVQVLSLCCGDARQQNRTEGDSFYFLDPDGHKLEIHCTTLAERIQDGKRHWGESVIWYC